MQQSSKNICSKKNGGDNNGKVIFFGESSCLPSERWETSRHFRHFHRDLFQKYPPPSLLASQSLAPLACICLFGFVNWSPIWTHQGKHQPGLADLAQANNIKKSSSPCGGKCVSNQFPKVTDWPMGRKRRFQGW